MTTKEIKEEAIKFIESIDDEQGLDIDITHGLRDTTPSDENHLAWANTKTHDGSFVMVIKGGRYK